MSRTIEIRENNVQCDITFPDDMPSIYVDDMSQLGIGVPVSRVLFHTLDNPPVQTAEDGSPIEQRNAALQLIIPTGSLVNFAKHVLSAASQNDENLASGFQDYGTMLKSSLEGLTITPVNPPSEQS